MAIDQRKYDMPLVHTLRDTRPFYIRLNEFLQDPFNAAIILGTAGLLLITIKSLTPFADLLFLACLIYVWRLKSIKPTLLFRLPAWSNLKDKRVRSGKADGILYLGNRKDGSSFWKGEELWFSNSDIRTHFLYLGTTGSGKTEGLKSIVSNALTWGSGFVFIDGKADTDLWSTLSALVRRFGRDDDLFVLNYMTGNSDIRAPSNSLNPFSSGSASYLTNMLVSLMPVADGDNAMWKERAISLLSSLMPSLTWLRDHMDAPLSVSTIRRYMQLNEIIRLSRMEALPERQRESLKGYLTTLPGYVDEAFDDYGRQKPMGPGTPMVDVQVPQQQHGYLTMQFTRSLQSLGDDYGYIFDTDKADVDMVDVVLNRRILVVLIPALEKSSDETANLGKIVAATIKGMMGSTLGATVEGDSTAVIENKPTYSSTPFMCVFDEVGYYTAQGMAVMAAQARSLGFSLVFAAQDLPAMEKRVKEEARSITANTNIKIFGKLEDPNQTVEFMEKSAGKAIVTEVSSFSMRAGSSSSSYFGTEQASRDLRFRITSDHVRMMREGEAALIFGLNVIEMNVFYANIGHAKALRVQRLIGLDPLDESVLKHREDLVKLRDRLVHAHWVAKQGTHSAEDSSEMALILESRNEGAVSREDNPLKKATASLVAYIAKTDPDALAGARRGKAPEASAPAAKEGDPMRYFSGDKPASQTAQERSFDELIDEDGDKEEEGSGSGSSDSRRMKKTGSYDPDRATEETMASGRIALPEGLRPEVEQLLRDAAKTLTTGLFAKPGTGLARGGLPVGPAGSTGGQGGGDGR